MERPVEIEAVRTVARNPFAWPGGYPVALIMSDGGLICAKCVKDNYRIILEATRDGDHSGWGAAGFYVYEGTTEDYDGVVACDNCNVEIISEEV